MDTLEEWRPIAGFEYEVSSFGRVRSWRSRFGRRSTPLVLSPRAASNGYLRVTLCGDEVRSERLIHHLVLEAFVGPRPSGMECRHFPDPSRCNNALRNLSWGTKEENERDKVAHGSLRTGAKHWTRKMESSIARGERHGHAKLSEQDALDILALRGAYGKPSQREVAEMFGVSRELVGLIWRGRIWKSLHKESSHAA